jgi:glucose-6-phosphate isomerase
MQPFLFVVFSLKKQPMISLRLDVSKAEQFLEAGAVAKAGEPMAEIHRMLLSGKGKGNDFLGWLNLPSGTDKDLIERITAEAAEIRSHSELLVVIGIGGSYLGARAVIDALGEPFESLKKDRSHPFIIYAGQNISENYHKSLLELLDHYSYSVAVISKSGTTTEPAVAFRLIRNHLEKKYGTEGARKRIIAVTDARKGALKKMADTEGYSSYIIPDDVGGRFSVLTPVGLLPIAVAGFDIRKIMEGAGAMEQYLKVKSDYKDNPAALYAIVRNLLYQSGKTTELMVSFESQLNFIIEWWKQLYGESEGKENKGIFPAGVNFTTDLHSMGQYIQEGKRNLFETVISVEKPSKELTIPSEKEDLDGLNFLSGKRMHEVNRMAELGTLIAHTDGGVPNIRLILPGISERTIGELIYFFEFACALSGYMLGVNPFDQPGVEAYKKNMFALLGKPGFEKEQEEIRKRF